METINDPPEIGEEFYVKAREHIARGEILNPLSDFVFKVIFSKEEFLPRKPRTRTNFLFENMAN